MTVTQYLSDIHEDQMALLKQKNNPKEILTYTIAVSLAINVEAGKGDAVEVSLKEWKSKLELFVQSVYQYLYVSLLHMIGICLVSYIEHHKHWH